MSNKYPEQSSKKNNYNLDAKKFSDLNASSDDAITVVLPQDSSPPATQVSDLCKLRGSPKSKTPNV
jgi:hypothetical protein